MIVTLKSLFTFINYNMTISQGTVCNELYINNLNIAYDIEKHMKYQQFYIYVYFKILLKVSDIFNN